MEFEARRLWAHKPRVLSHLRPGLLFWLKQISGLQFSHLLNGGEQYTPRQARGGRTAEAVTWEELNWRWLHLLELLGIIYIHNSTDTKTHSVYVTKATNWALVKAGLLCVAIVTRRCDTLKHKLLLPGGSHNSLLPPSKDEFQVSKALLPI